MSHNIEVHLATNIEKYKKGMDDAKRIGGDSMGAIGSIVSKIKQMFSGLWDSLKSFFSGAGDKFKGAFSAISDGALSAFQKVAGYLPGFHSDLDKTKAKMGETEEKSSSLASKIATTLVAAIVAVTVVTAAFVKQGLEADAALASAAITTDIAASKISRFEDTAARSGLSVKDLGASMGKFHDEMKKAAESSDQSIFDKLGVKVTDSNNALRDTDAVMIEVAQKIAGMSSEAEKYQAAAKVGFDGKSQVLEDIAHAHTLVSSKTDEQAGAVVRLGKIWHEILPGGKSMWSKIGDVLTTSLTPAMVDASVSALENKNRIVDAFNQIYGGGSVLDKLGEKIRTWSQDASKWFASVAKSTTDMEVSLMKWVAAKTGLGNAAVYKPQAGYVPGPVKLTSDKHDPVVKEEDVKAYNNTTRSINERIAAMRLQVKTGESVTEGQRMMIQMDEGLRDGTLKLTDAQKTARVAQINTLIDLEKSYKKAQDAKALSETATKKEQEQYASLISAIQSKIDVSKVELQAGSAATESQKLEAKLNAEIAAGKMKLTPEHLKAARAKLVELAASEKLVKAQQAEQDVAKYIDESRISRQKMADALQVEYQMYGKSNDARAIAMVAVDAEAWKKKEILDLETKKLPITQETLNRLEAEKQLRIQVGQALVSQTQALQYAADLEQENRRYAAEQITDASASKRALLRIDVDLWHERIKNAGDGTTAQRLLQTQFDTWYTNRLAETDPWYGMQQSLKQYGREASDVGSQIGNAMTNAFRGAEDAFATFVTTGKLSFRDLATSIIADMARMQAKAALSGFASYLGTALGSWLGGPTASAGNFDFMPSAQNIDKSLFSDLSYLDQMPHRANGGSVVGGQSYVVGERGEEVFTPSSNGTITPNHALGGGEQSITIQTNVHIDANGGSTTTSSGDQGAAGKALADMMASTAKDVIARESRQGGLLWKMKMGR